MKTRQHNSTNTIQLVIGSNGQLGRELQRLATKQQQCKMVFVDRSQLDVTDTQKIADFCKQHQIGGIINCAAYTAVDKAENDSETAQQINHFAVKGLAEIAKTQALSLIHISTDYVFSGQRDQPYRETDAPNPQTVYGLSKWQGEQAILAINPERSAIIRTSWLYSPHRQNFVKTMLHLGKERHALRVVADQIGTPTYAGDLAEAILFILPHLDDNKTEIYHYSNTGTCSWYDFAKAIFDLTKHKCKIQPISSNDYPTAAQRPRYSVLDKTKIQQRFGLVIPRWRDSLRRCLQALDSGCI